MKKCPVMDSAFVTKESGPLCTSCPHRAQPPEPQITHFPGCWQDGPAHWGCAVEEIKRLERQRQSENAKLLAKIDGLDAEKSRLLDYVNGMPLPCSACPRRELLRAKAAKLPEALREAATSLETISLQSGKEELMKTPADIRGYANSRAGVEFAAIREWEGK